MTSKLSSFSSLEELSMAIAEQVTAIANEAIEKRGVFRIALAGGSTPKRLYQVLSSDRYKKRTEWEAWAIYFGDERIVPLDDERSNYAMANEALLANVPIEEANIFAPPVSLGDPATVAQEYERTIRDSTGVASSTPNFDLILLGLGSDGHTASLFPGKPALEASDRLVAESTPGVLPPPIDRITFTLPLLNAAHHVIFLAGGKDKIDAFKAAYMGGPLGDIEHVPAYLVQPANGELQWFITDELNPTS